MCFILFEIDNAKVTIKKQYCSAIFADANIEFTLYIILLKPLRYILYRIFTFKACVNSLAYFQQKNINN